MAKAGIGGLKALAAASVPILPFPVGNAKRAGARRIRAAVDVLYCAAFCAPARRGRAIGWMAEWLCSGLQLRVRRFDSDPRLQILHCCQLLAPSQNFPSWLLHSRTANVVFIYLPKVAWPSGVLSSLMYLTFILTMIAPDFSFTRGPGDKFSRLVFMATW